MTPWTVAHQAPLFMELIYHPEISLLGICMSKIIESSNSNRWGFPGGTSGKECRRHKRCRFNPWVGKIPWSREWRPTPVFLPGESHGQRSLAGYGPRGGKESDSSKRLSTHAQTRREYSGGLATYSSLIFRLMIFGVKVF